MSPLFETFFENIWRWSVFHFLFFTILLLKTSFVAEFFKVTKIFYVVWYNKTWNVLCSRSTRKRFPDISEYGKKTGGQGSKTVFFRSFWELWTLPVKPGVGPKKWAKIVVAKKA